jgi:hypothetical protein
MAAQTAPRDWFVQANDLNHPVQRRAGFEVAGWDGTRWIAEGVYDDGPAAATQARVVLNKRLGVKITQEVFSPSEGLFKSRVIFTEFRGDPPKSEKRPVREVQPARRGAVNTFLASRNAALYIAMSSLVISILALIFAVLR